MPASSRAQITNRTRQASLSMPAQSQVIPRGFAMVHQEDLTRALDDLDARATALEAQLAEIQAALKPWYQKAWERVRRGL